MNVDAVASTPGAGAGPLTARTLLTPAGAAPRVVYRDVSYVRLAPGALAGSLALDAAACALGGAFTSYDFDALAIAEPTLQASTRSLGGGTVAVELGAPRRLRSIQVAHGKVPSTGYTLEVYRLDGDTPSGQPTTTATNAIETANVVGEAVVVGGAGGGDVVAGATENAYVLEARRTFWVDFTDARFALRLKQPGGGYVTSLAPGDVDVVSVRSYPSSPRVRVAFPQDPASPVGDPTAAVPVWQAAGEIGGAVPATAGTFDAADALADALARGAARLADAVQASASAASPVPPLPPTIDVALVIESDAPCRFQPAGFAVAYRPVTSAFASGEEKATVRFAGAGAAASAPSVRLPGGATVVSAELRATPSLRTGRPGGVDAAAASAPPTSRAGIRVGAGRQAAQVVQPDAALEATGFLLGVIPLDDGVELHAALVEDAGGAPAGRVLAEGTLATGVPGRPAWLSWRLDAPLVVTTARHWVRLAAASGEAVWLSAAGSGPACALADDGSTLATLTDRDLMVLPVVGAGANGGPPGDAAPRLDVAGMSVSASAGADGRLVYDLAAALTAALTGQPPGAVVEVPLSFASPAPGSLTVYPPRIEFEPATA